MKSISSKQNAVTSRLAISPSLTFETETPLQILSITLPSMWSQRLRTLNCIIYNNK